MTMFCTEPVQIFFVFFFLKIAIVSVALMWLCSSADKDGLFHCSYRMQEINKITYTFLNL